MLDDFYEIEVLLWRENLQNIASMESELWITLEKIVAEKLSSDRDFTTNELDSVAQARGIVASEYRERTLILDQITPGATKQPKKWL